MNTIPIVLTNRSFLIIGAGDVALQKAKVLHRNNMAFTLISKEISEEIEMLAKSSKIKSFEASDLQGFDVVINATGSASVTATLLRVKKEHNFLLNVVDAPEHCDFFFAALLEYGRVKIAVSSSGASPTLAKKIRDKIAEFLPSGIKNLAEESYKERKAGLIDSKEMIDKVEKLFS